jgi:hypothetical protein
VVFRGSLLRRSARFGFRVFVTAIKPLGALAVGQPRLPPEVGPFGTNITRSAAVRVAAWCSEIRHSVSLRPLVRKPQRKGSADADSVRICETPTPGD